MLEFARRAHANQFRNNGRVPYWMHVLSVSQILERALAEEVVPNDVREDMLLAALGHDLYEDTAIDPDDIRLRFGERVAHWIEAMTNRQGDSSRDAYVQQMTMAEEEVRLIKLADLAENTASVSYAVPDMGLVWVRDVFLPLAEQMWNALRGTEFVRYEHAARSLRWLVEYGCDRVKAVVEMYDMDRVATNEAAPTTHRANTEISDEAWQKALEETRRKERAAGAKFPGGRPFAVPRSDEDP